MSEVSEPTGGENVIQFATEAVRPEEVVFAPEKREFVVDAGQREGAIQAGIVENVLTPGLDELKSRMLIWPENENSGEVPSLRPEVITKIESGIGREITADELQALTNRAMTLSISEAMVPRKMLRLGGKQNGSLMRQAVLDETVTCAPLDEEELPKPKPGREKSGTVCGGISLDYGGNFRPYGRNADEVHVHQGLVISVLEREQAETGTKYLQMRLDAPVLRDEGMSPRQAERVMREGRQKAEDARKLELRRKLNPLEGGLPGQNS